MKLMLHHATGLPGANSQHPKRTSKSFIFFDVLLHGQEILTVPIMFFLVQRFAVRISSGQR
jgi:hypothetical protein